jgi:hypothetical protein
MANGQRPAIVGPGRPGRPSYPKWPLDPDCLEPGEPRLDVVELVRLVQTDFAPETDPAGWDSVAELVRGSGRPWEEVRQMDYDQLAAFFRVRSGSLKIQLGGVVETNTATIVSYNAAPPTADGRAQTSQTPKRKMRPEEHLYFLYLRDPKVATLESRALPDLAEAALGESFSDRYYRDTDLYREWRTALEETVHHHGEGWLEGDVLEAGLEIYGHKPGRSDKRPTLDRAHEAAVKDFLRDTMNATVRAQQRLENGGK